MMANKDHNEYMSYFKDKISSSVTPANLLQGAFTILVSTLKELDSSTGEFAKSMNMTYSESLEVRSNMLDIASSTHDVSVNSNGKSVISWSSTSTDVDVYALYILDEFGAWITIDSVYGFNNTSYVFNSSNAINNFETFSVRSLDSCGNASSRSIMHNSMNITSKVNICDLSINVFTVPIINLLVLILQLFRTD